MEMKWMARSPNRIDVYLEIGKKRVFAGAVDWPGWCRGGRDAGNALQALFDNGPRYAQVLNGTGLGFQAPGALSAFSVVERLAGNATTDFGAPDVAPPADAKAVDDAELQRFQALLKACWQAFDAAAEAAEGKELRKGPRGGGRDVEGITRHVLGADAGYLSRLAWKLEPSDEADLRLELDRTRQAILEALAAAARGEVAERGPRGGARWSPRYFVRRVAWHVLDHAWEIEDRVE
jgi:DinB family protein